MATTKAVIAVTNREKKKAQSFDAIIFDLATKLSKYIRLGDYKKRKMTATLKSAGVNLSPETYISKAIVKTALILTLVIPCFLIFSIVAPIVVFLSVAVFFKEYKLADEIVKKKRDAIEDELSRKFAFLKLTAWDDFDSYTL